MPEVSRGGRRHGELLDGFLLLFFVLYIVLAVGELVVVHAVLKVLFKADLFKNRLKVLYKAHLVVSILPSSSKMSTERSYVHHLSGSGS